VSFARLDDEVAAFWLDGRHVPEDAAMSLYAALLNATPGARFETRIDERVCDCCQTDAVALADGTLLVVYRDRSEAEVRDIAIVTGRIADGLQFDEPRSLHADGWKIDGCPVNGPAIAASSETVAVAWFTIGADQKGRVLLAFSADGGASFSAPLRIDGGTETAGRVDVVFVGELALVSWLEREGERYAWKCRLAERTGRLGATTVIAPVDGERDDGFLRMVAIGDGGAWCAWRADRSIALGRVQLTRK